MNINKNIRWAIVVLAVCSGAVNAHNVGEHHEESKAIDCSKIDANANANADEQDSVVMQALIKNCQAQKAHQKSEKMHTVKSHNHNHKHDAVDRAATSD